MVNRQVTLLFGPPCAGKTTHAQQHAQPGDLIIDVDLIAQELGSTDPWQHPPAILRRAQDEWRRRVDAVGRMRTGTVWIIRCAPTHAERARLTRVTGATHVQLLMPGDKELQARAAARPDPTSTVMAIRRWSSTYHLDQRSQRVKAGRATGGSERTSQPW